MPTIQLEERIFKVVQQNASDAGYANVDDYVADILIDNVSDRVDQLFTSERLAAIDRASTQIQTGSGRTREEAETELALLRNKWLQENPRSL